MNSYLLVSAAPVAILPGEDGRNEIPIPELARASSLYIKKPDGAYEELIGIRFEVEGHSYALWFEQKPILREERNGGMVELTPDTLEGVIDHTNAELYSSQPGYITQVSYAFTGGREGKTPSVIPF